MKLIRIYTSIYYFTLLISTRVIYQSRCFRKICQFFRGFIIVDEGAYNETMLRMTKYNIIILSQLSLISLIRYQIKAIIF